MEPTLHPQAPHSLPWFITAPGQTDYLYNGAVIFLILVVLFAGSLYLHLHALPERMSHGRRQHQFEFVAVLALIALFTHNSLFWFAALLLALVRIPDFTTPVEAMSRSLDRIARGIGAPSDDPPADDKGEPVPEPPAVAAETPDTPEPAGEPVPDGDPAAEKA